MTTRTNDITHLCLALLILLAVSTLRLPAVELDQLPYVPTDIQKCLETSTVKRLAKVSFNVNPFYLRGDFDGDNRPDYAISVRGPKSKRNGILFCMANDTSFVVGADQPKTPAFSDMPDDNFVAPNWEVLSKADQNELRRFTSNVPHPMPHGAGDAIGLIWEDGIAVIYWNGHQFRWSAPKQ